MADIKQISVSAPIYTTQDNSSNTNIVTNVSTDTVDTPTLSSLTPNIVAQANSTELNVVVTNMGEENVPDPRLFKRLSDTFGYSEQLVRAVAKVLADLSTTQDQVVAAVGKVLADSTTNSEVISRVVQYYRTYTDSTTNLEQLQKTIAKVLADITSNSEVLSQLVGKTAQDTTTTSEQRVFQADKVLEDWVDGTDDVLGEANIDDDQYAEVGKTLVDYATTSDQIDTLATFDRQFADTDTVTDLAQFSVGISKLDSTATTDERTLAVDKLAQDQTTTAEQAYLNPNKVAQETATTTETKQLTIDANKLDQAIVSETFAKDIFPVVADQTVTSETFDRTVDFNRTLVESGTATEQVQKSVEPVLTDTTTTSELTTQLVDKVAEDTTTTSEQQVFQADKILEDWVDATDDVLGEANIDDDQYAEVGKAVVDYIANTDLITTTAAYNRTFTETKITSELVTRAVQAVYEDTATTSETFDRTVDFNRAYTDQAINADELQKAIATVFAEITAVTEAVTQLIDKAAQESISTSEYKVFQTDKVLEDLVDATDDFDGAATIEDDQYAQVDKTLSDYATTNESVTVAADYNRTATDTDTITDLVILAVQPAYQETVNSQEQLVKDITTTLTESKILSEVFAAVINKALSDNTNSSDTVTLVGALSKTETVSISETKTLAMQSYFATDDYVEAGYVGEYYTY